MRHSLKTYHSCSGNCTRKVCSVNCWQHLLATTHVQASQYLLAGSSYAFLSQSFVCFFCMQRDHAMGCLGMNCFIGGLQLCCYSIKYTRRMAESSEHTQQLLVKEIRAHQHSTKPRPMPS